MQPHKKLTGCVTMQKILERIIPFIGLAIVIGMIAFSIVLFFYVLFFVVIIGMVWFVAHWIWQRFIHKKINKKPEEKGRIIDSDHWDRL